MDLAEREILELILDTRELSPEVLMAVCHLLDQEEASSAMTRDQVHQLIDTLLKCPEAEDSKVKVGGIIHR